MKDRIGDKPAPDRLRIVQAFLNTATSGREDFASPDCLREWLADHGLIDGDAPLSASDLRHAISEEYRKEITEFEQRKGPDFISRLRGYINIPDANAGPGRSKHFLRRAIQLRGLLENKVKLVEPKGGPNEGRAKVDEAVIYALLTIDHYRHGVRSMEAILRMCAPIAPNDKHIYISSLPARAQLNMHVDAEEFTIRVRRGRSRAAKFLPRSGRA